MTEEDDNAIRNIRKDSEYYDILMNIKNTNYNMVNVEKLMRDTKTGDYTEYEIAECIVYLIYKLEESVRYYASQLEKNKKQIEELKEITKTYDSYIGEKMPLNSQIIIADGKYFMNGTFVNKFVNKDKIKEILFSISTLYDGGFVKVEFIRKRLEELL